MKFYDFDGMFDLKLSEFVQKNPGKYTESEWEDFIPKLYKNFGDTFIKSVGDTPNGFYSKLSDEELVTALTTHIKKGVRASEFLVSAIEKRDAVKLLLPLLDGSKDEQEYAVSIIGADERAIKKYMQLLVNPETSGELKETLVDLIKQKADLVVNEAANNYENAIERGYMLEIMSRSIIRSDRVFDILIREFRIDSENVPLHASYLAQYGDERALQFLLDKIDEETITFLEYKELLLAIESLGGIYRKQRDFSSDPYYEVLKSHEASPQDIFVGMDKK